MADEQNEDLKEEASLSFRANAADLASMLAIGESHRQFDARHRPRFLCDDHDLSRRNHQIRHSTGWSSGSDAGRTACVDLCGPQGAADVSPCTEQPFGGSWHWVETCSGWPTTNFLEQLDRPPERSSLPYVQNTRSERNRGLV